MRRGNVPRLPLPPTVKGTLMDAGDDINALRDHVNTMTVILNQALQSMQTRLNTVQQTGASTPPTVTGLVVTGKQGLFHLTWNRIAHVDGYAVVQASDTAMSQLVGRFNLPDGDTCSYQIPVGNVAVTNSFQVYAYQGAKYSQPSNIITAATILYGSAEAIPPAPPLAPRHPKVAPIRNGLTLK